MLKYATTLLTAAAVCLALPGNAEAQRSKAPKPACGITAFPMIQGAVWVYGARALPNPPKKPLPKPKQPEKITITVKSVVTEGRGKDETSTIVLEEDLGYRKYETTLKCKKDVMDVPPDSLFFSGHPGGGLAIALGEVERTENSYKFQRGKMVIPAWLEGIKTTFTRQAAEGTEAKLGGGSLDLQRDVKIGLVEPVTTDAGTFDATPLQVILLGSVILDVEAESKTYNIPANTISKMWFADNVGVVQIANTNAHLYQLLEYKPPEPEAPAKK